MDSSPDLSLKLRRGSSDSRDTFYMDFAQGIDSDIEEVDNSAIKREPQQTPTPPPPIVDVMDMNLSSASVLPPPPLPSMLQHQPLPTLSEQDDLPPSPPLQQDEEDNGAGSIDLASPLVSPTTSVLEMIPPPPLPPSPPPPAMEAEQQPQPSPPAETEDEGDEQNDGDIDEDYDEEDGKSTPPPPLPPLLDRYSGISPTMTKSPSTSPSPPITPPPCPQMICLDKIVSPPMSHVPPLTPPSESDQSQPSSPPPLPPHTDMRGTDDQMMSIPPPQAGSPLPGADQIMPSTPPPEFMETDDMIAAAVAATLGSASPDLIKEVLEGGGLEHQYGGEDIKSLNDDESTTITTPPTNGYSASSIVVPQGELEHDYGLNLADIPPPAGMESQDDDIEGEDDIEVEEENTREKTPTSEAPMDEVITDEHTTADTPVESPAAVSISGSPKKSSVGKIHSRSGSRSGSHSASRSGSARGSIGSRPGSIKGGSVCSGAQSVASAASTAAAGAAVAAISSPQASLKSIKSQHSIKSTYSSKKGSPPIGGRMRSPSGGESPTSIRSSSGLRSPLAKSQSPVGVPSPPRLCSPPLRQKEAELIEKADIKSPVGTDVLPLAAAAAVASVVANSEGVVSSPTVPSSMSASTTLSYQDELSSQHVMRPQLSSHHHYHLPHQFQHPHHQNHHPHIHGGMPVPTPIVPASYAATTLLRSSLSAAGSGTDDDSAPMPMSSTAMTAQSQATIAATSSTASNLLLTETVSHASVSPARASQLRVTIDESNLHPTISTVSMGGGGDDDGDSGPPSPGGSSQQQLASLSGDRQTGHLALMYHSHQLSNFPVLPAIKRHRPSFVYPPMPKVKAGDALATLFSALYGKMLVVMGVAFPMAEVISTYIPPSFYEVYYLYLYIGSMIFLLFMYATLLWGKPKLPPTLSSPTKLSAKTRTTSASESLDESDTESNSTQRKHIPAPMTSARRPSLLSPLGRQHHYGSFYLRMGAVAFGIGSMIYSGLEFGQYFELTQDTKCHNVLLAVTPATRMAFIFIQMYFIFLNNEQIKVYRYKIIARFGLMHMIGTNLAVWLNVLIQETKHEILTFYNPENRTLRISHRIPALTRGHAVLAATEAPAHVRLPRGLKGPYHLFECRRTNIIGTLVQDASPFLFPCTIEYSLICAAILYVMWRSISRPHTPTPQRPDMISSPMKRSPHHYSVDCARAHKGLFVGILILVLTIISLIIFFVLISRPEFVALAVTEVTICELLIYGTATIATLVGMIQVRVLQYDAYRSFSLDDILLVGAQTGSFLYNIFTVIAGQFSIRRDDMLVPINALASMVQTAGQTMFILDASRRQAVTPEHMRKKPGREIVTFMLVVNLAMWAISTLEKSRAESHPIQLNFYGLWAWTIITHVSMPLAIFYRFHSTVCLCEIWKRAYKLKPTYM